MCIYKDGTHLATASTDKTVKLIDTQTLDVLRVYQTDRPANAVALSPIFDQVCNRHVLPFRPCQIAIEALQFKLALQRRLPTDQAA